MQRTRCYYFYDPSFSECNKRTPGSGCAAIHGVNRLHAILGASEHCIATHPSDMAVALAALDANVITRDAKGEHSLPVASFYRLPGATPAIETELKAGDLITAVEIAEPPASSRSFYLKVRDRNSYAFALVSVAALVDLGPDGRILKARLALGGVAAKPWRVPAAESALEGREAGESVFREAADLLLRGATPHRDNTFKIELARRSIIRALQTASARG